MVFTTEDVQTRALSGVNLVIKPGEFVAIMGVGMWEVHVAEYFGNP